MDVAANSLALQRNLYGAQSVPPMVSAVMASCSTPHYITAAAWHAWHTCTVLHATTCHAISPTALTEAFLAATSAFTCLMLVSVSRVSRSSVLAAPEELCTAWSEMRGGGGGVSCAVLCYAVIGDCTKVSQQANRSTRLNTISASIMSVQQH